MKRRVLDYFGLRTPEDWLELGAITGVVMAVDGWWQTIGAVLALLCTLELLRRPR